MKSSASPSLSLVAKGLTDKQNHEIEMDKGKRHKVKVTPFLNGEIKHLKVRGTLYLVIFLMLNAHGMILPLQINVRDLKQTPSSATLNLH